MDGQEIVGWLNALRLNHGTRSAYARRMSPAMAAGVVDRLFDVSDLVNLLIESESKSRPN
jgi:hypothetical protein